MARAKNSNPQQLPLPFDAALAARRGRPVRSIGHHKGFMAWCEREEQKREVCEPMLQLHAAGVAFVAIVVARALAKEVV